MAYKEPQARKPENRAKHEARVESKRLHLESGEKIKQVKGDSPAYDKTEAPPGIMVGKVKKFV